MDKKEPFTQEDLNKIFKISPAKPDRVFSRENSTLEFKESFGWKSLADYLRTSASYANTQGGYIVFGIANKPHKLKGLTGATLKHFEEITPEKLSEHFNEHFSPEIAWDIQEYELDGKVFGLFYIHESEEKPVLCKKNAEKSLKEGEIYYRYRGRSERIKYPELRAIMEAKRENEQKLWMHHLANIARIGVRDAGIFDLQTGKVTGTGGAFIIDESLLSQLSFIKEGEFSEIKGKPTLKLIGEVETIGELPPGLTKKEIIKTKGIRISDIVGAFLNHEKVSDPKAYISQICFESTAFLPIYYFMKKTGLSREQTIQSLNEAVSRQPSKTKLIERLQNGNTQFIPLRNSATPASRKKQDFSQKLMNNTVASILSEKDMTYCLQAIRSIPKKDIKKHQTNLCKLLRTWFNQHYASANGTLADNLRRAICWVDEALYMEPVE